MYPYWKMGHPVAVGVTTVTLRPRETPPLAASELGPVSGEEAVRIATGYRVRTIEVEC